MNKQDKNFNYHEHDRLPDTFPGMSNVASAGETTGSMPTPPQNAEELRAYQDLANMAIPKTAPGKKEGKEVRRVDGPQYPDFRP